MSSSYMAVPQELNFLNPESHRLFRNLIENIKIGVFMADSRQKLFYVNHNFCDTFQLFNHTHALGKNWAQLILPDENQRASCLSLLQKNGNVNDFETVHVIGGQKMTLLITAHSILNDHGKTIGIRGVLFNITERLNLEKQIVSEHHKLEQILSFYQNLETAFQLDELTQFIVKQTSSIFNAQRCSLMLLETVSNELYIKDSCGIPKEFVQNSRVKIGEPVAGMLALQKHPILVEDIGYSEYLQPNKSNAYHYPSFISAPLIYEQKIIGLLNVSEREGGFKQIDLKVLESIAQQSAVSIEKIIALNKYQHLAQTDSMTGLFNFRTFTQKLDEEVQRSDRYNQPLSLIMIDVDNFKLYNDTHGHPSGDKLLKDLAELFKNNVRSTESVCRYGGDEFSIILPNTPDADAALVAQKLQELIVKKFSSDNMISLSFGVAQHQQKVNKDSLIQQADQALYQAKKAGRNRISVFKS